jgi:ferritin-like metal-binding protein YciE
LDELSNEAWDAKLTAALDKHLAETEKHATNVKAVFRTVGVKPKVGKCPAIKALRKEHHRFVAREKPNRPILDVVVARTAARAEHYEIAAYTSLISLADALDETKASTLLERNRKQDDGALKTATRAATRLARRPHSDARAT